MKKQEVKHNNYSSISIKEVTKERLLDSMHKYGYRNYDPFIDAMLDTLKKFKSELKEMQQ